MRSSSRARAALIQLLLITTIAALAVPASAGAKVTARVTGGTKAPDAQYQSHLRSTVALVRVTERTQYDGQFCAGTLIDELHVVTAGHCLVDDGDLRTRIAPSSFAVLPGTPKLNERSMDRSKLVPIAAMFINPNFNVRTMRWDVAVLRLARPITDVPIMPLLSGDEAATLGVGTNTVQGIVAGWGDEDPDEDDCCFSSDLQSVQVPLQPDSLCRANLARAAYLSFSSEFQLCAGRLGTNRRLGADTCQGDSGGPIYVDAAGGVRLAGVTSFGVGCGQRFYGVYARATTIMPWLASIPGIVAGDTRDPTNGPGDLGVPSGSATPADFEAVNLSITPPPTGATPTSYTVWARVGPAGVAQDIYLGQTTSPELRLRVPASNSAVPYQLLVRGVTVSGEGPTASVRAAPVLDRVKPTVPAGVTISGRTATWRAAADRQSGIGGYLVQVRTGSGWGRTKPTQARRYPIGRASQVRVRAVDDAGNLSAWSRSAIA